MHALGGWFSAVRLREGHCAKHRCTRVRGHGWRLHEDDSAWWEDTVGQCKKGESEAQEKVVSRTKGEGSGSSHRDRLQFQLQQVQSRGEVASC